MICRCCPCDAHADNVLFEGPTRKDCCGHSATMKRFPLMCEISCRDGACARTNSVTTASLQIGHPDCMFGRPAACTTATSSHRTHQHNLLAKTATTPLGWRATTLIGECEGQHRARPNTYANGVVCAFNCLQPQRAQILVRKLELVSLRWPGTNGLARKHFLLTCYCSFDM